MGMPLAFWSRLSSVPVNLPSALFATLRTSRNLEPPASSVPCQSPSRLALAWLPAAPAGGVDCAINICQPRLINTSTMLDTFRIMISSLPIQPNRNFGGTTYCCPVINGGPQLCIGFCANLRQDDRHELRKVSGYITSGGAKLRCAAAFSGFEASG